MKIGIVTDIPFLLNARGDQARVFHLIEGLLEFPDLSISVIDLSNQKAIDPFEQRANYLNLKTRKISILKSLIKTKPRLFDFNTYRKNVKQKATVELLLKNNFDLVIFEYLRLKPISDLLKLSQRPHQQTKIAVDIHDIQAIRADSFANAGLSWVATSLATELSMINSFDKVISIQDEETETLTTTISSKKIFTLPHLPRIKTLPPLERQPILTLGFIGSNATPNRDALEAFIDKILPFLQSELALEFKIKIAGSICNHIQANKKIELLGKVDSLLDFYSQIDIAINPVRAGSGLKIKTIEAMMMSKPLITTVTGAQGLPFTRSRPFWIAESPESWRDSILSILHLNPQTIAEQSKNYLNTFFNRQRLFEEFVNFLKT